MLGVWMVVLCILGLSFQQQMLAVAGANLAVVGLAIIITPMMARPV